MYHSILGIQLRGVANKRPTCILYIHEPKEAWQTCRHANLYLMCCDVGKEGGGGPTHVQEHKFWYKVWWVKVKEIRPSHERRPIWASKSPNLGTCQRLKFFYLILPNPILKTNFSNVCDPYMSPTVVITYGNLSSPQAFRVPRYVVLKKSGPKEVLTLLANCNFCTP